MIKSIGFFHFVRGHEDPFGNVVSALEKKKSEDGALTGALIVLPEAFNLGGSYQPGPRPGFVRFPLRYALQRLQTLAYEYEVAFVTALLGDQLSSAYWIEDGREPALMCRKVRRDNSGSYNPCLHSCDLHNPIVLADMRVGALICNDAFDDGLNTTGEPEIRREAQIAAERRQRLKQEILVSKATHSVLCIPASTRTPEYVMDMRGVYRIVANSVNGSKSCIMRDEESLANEQSDDNLVCIIPISG